MVILIASWGKYRLPVALAPIDPQIKGHQNILFREMIEKFCVPAWAHTVIVEADAGFAANKTFSLIEECGYFYVVAVARTRKFEDGKHVSDLALHLPKIQYRRIASYKPSGRRRDYWTYTRKVKLNGLGRCNDGSVKETAKRRAEEDQSHRHQSQDGNHRRDTVSVRASLGSRGHDKGTQDGAPSRADAGHERGRQS